MSVDHARTRCLTPAALSPARLNAAHYLAFEAPMVTCAHQCLGAAATSTIARKRRHYKLNISRSLLVPARCCGGAALTLLIEI